MKACSRLTAFFFFFCAKTTLKALKVLFGMFDFDVSVFEEFLKLLGAVYYSCICFGLSSSTLTSFSCLSFFSSRLVFPAHGCNLKLHSVNSTAYLIFIFYFAFF